MANKQFAQAPTLQKATLRMGSYDVPCSVLMSNGSTAHVRVMTAGGHFGEVAFVQGGEVRQVRITLRKQGPLGLDLWLDLETAHTAQAA
ncbi:hypothetical protein [Methylobacterium sp. J-067]|jgi:hypothetical protein|uniref:hypothetical protein n=1 Tax=Methylobacterium sp. J-067 TaxID=2836648 RepID=UPI001FBA7F39|nr:hypothetical protein [Methylobacterium sp. J-067]MCJ2023277.1 hypothetical protein [Methylobacterium sp. J-067]